MRKLLRAIGVTMFAALSLFYVVFGGIYASVEDLLWFHAAAVPEQSRDAVRPLYFALMTLIGGATIALGVIGAFLAFTPVRRGDSAAAAALFLANAIPLIAAAYVAETLAATTGAPTSWRIMGALMAVNAVALACVLIGGRAPSRGANAESAPRGASVSQQVDETVERES